MWAAVQSIPNQRGEYETTAVFEARQYAALTEIDPVYWIEMPLNGEFVSYDADTERLIVPVYAAYAGFLITATSANRLFGVGSDYARRYINLVGVRARSESIDTGSYRGETGLGVQRNVRQVDQITRYLFERVDRTGSLLNQRRQAQPDDVWFGVSVPPADARQVREGGFWSVVYAPAAPFWASGEATTRPSVSVAVERREIDRALTGDIQCLLLHKANGEVVAFRATR